MTKLLILIVSLLTPGINYGYSAAIYYVLVERGLAGQSALRYMNWFAAVPLALVAVVVVVEQGIALTTSGVWVMSLLPIGAGLYLLDTKLKEWWTGTEVVGGTRSPFAMLPIVVVPVFEEIIYRAGLAVVSDSLGVPAFVVVSGLAFGLHHVGMGKGEVVRKAVGGTIYATLYVTSGSLLPPIVMHVGYNVASVAVIVDWSRL